MRILIAIAATSAACGSVKLDAPDGGLASDGAGDAAVATDAMAGPDAWASHCAPAAPITNIEDNHTAFSSTCIHGSWTLSSVSGTTVPTSAGQAASVIPTPIVAGTNPFDPASTFVIHVSGSGQATVGGIYGYATLGMPFNTIENMPSGTVDASTYTGIQFSGKLVAGALGIRLGIANLYTDPVGGMCSGTGGAACYDDPSAALSVGAGWTTYQVPFATLTQRGFGNPSPLGASFPRDHITRLNWLVIVPDSGPTEPWDLVIDNVTFY